MQIQHWLYCEKRAEWNFVDISVYPSWMQSGVEIRSGLLFEVAAFAKIKKIIAHSSSL
jgi:hypothetical protein